MQERLQVDIYMHFNTSNVTIQRGSSLRDFIVKQHFNTSNVTIQRTLIERIIEWMEFQYI